MPAPASEAAPWYSFDFGPIHFLQYNTEVPFNKGSPQHRCALLWSRWCFCKLLQMTWSSARLLHLTSGKSSVTPWQARYHAHMVNKQFALRHDRLVRAAGSWWRT